MDEIEVKILEIDRRGLEKKLAGLGAEKTFDGEIYGIFYDFPDNSIREAKDTMRLRRVGGRSYIAYKKFVGNAVGRCPAKVREEYEVEVSDFESARLILLSLGLVPWMEMRKHRTTYELPGVSFELDKHTDGYSYVPEFMEIEAADVGTLYRYVEALGYERSDCRPWTIVEVADYYQTNRKQAVPW